MTNKKAPFGAGDVLGGCVDPLTLDKPKFAEPNFAYPGVRRNAISVSIQ